MQRTASEPAPPPYLAEAGRRFWLQVVQEWELDVRSLALLAAACKQADRAAEAREILQQQPVVILDRFGQPKTHPAVDVERNASLAFVRILREIGLDVEPPPDSRPPRRPGT